MQGRNQHVRRRWSVDLALPDDHGCPRWPAIKVLVGVIVGPKRRAFQRHTGEHAPRAGIRQYVRAQIRIRRCLGVAALRTRSRRCICAEFHFAVQQAANTPIVDHQKDEVGRFSANLESYAAASSAYIAGVPRGPVKSLPVRQIMVPRP